MAVFSHQVFPDADLTVITVSGAITTEDILAYSSQLHAQPDVTRLFLWDAREIVMEDAGAKEFRGMGRKMKGIVHTRRNGKTAIVTNSDLYFGFGRMYSSYAEMEESTISYHIFRDMDKAMAWLKE